MAELLEFLAKQLVDDPDAVRVERVDEADAVVLRLHVAQDDLGTRRIVVAPGFSAGTG